VFETTTVDADEQAARAILGRIGRGESLRLEDHRFAAAIGFELDRAAYPFVLATGSGAQEHAVLAARLRAQRALAASEDRRVVGFIADPAARPPIALGPGAVLAVGHAAVRDERGLALDELRLVVGAALARGRSGLIETDELLPELLLLSAPRLAGRLRARLYDPLETDHPELARTLDALIEHEFERRATAAAIPVHRNTLRDRIKRITELTGVELDTAQGRAMAWLAWLESRLS
jgi:DNA-binding PucR family transcriptional regulator